MGSKRQQIVEPSLTQETFAEVYRRYNTVVMHTFLEKGFPPERAHELTQDVFLRVYTNWNQFKGEAPSFRAWLFTIVGSVWKNELRAMGTQKRGGLFVSLEDATESLAMDDMEPLQDMLREESLAYLRKAITQLSEPVRTSLILRVYHQLKYTEIANLLKLPLAQVKNLLHKARQQLQEHLPASDSCDNSSIPEQKKRHF